MKNLRFGEAQQLAQGQGKSRMWQDQDSNQYPTSQKFIPFLALFIVLWDNGIVFKIITV